MSELDNIEGLLYGKPLQCLVTSALMSLQLENSENDILIKTVSAKILEKRPELKIFVDTVRSKTLFRQRLTNCIKQMGKTNLVSLSLEKTKNIDYQYIIIKPNLL